ncbi:MAG: hypothetical protein AAGC60_11455 [Acidobacteriota bacterium]
MRAKDILALVLATAVALALVACQPSEEAEEAPGAEQLAFIDANEPVLAEKRAQLDSLRAELKTFGDAEPSDAEPAEGEEPPPTREELEAQVAELEGEIEDLGGQFYTAVVDFLNSQEILEGAELTPGQRRVFDLKAQEDILVADEYIVRGGDWGRAIEIYESALLADPTNEALLAAKATAEEMRFMNEERFSQVEKGMTQDAVRDLLGTVKPSNIRDFEERNRIGWFYRKEDRGAAGVYFKPKTQGGEEIWVVEVADYDAVPSPTEGGDGEI